MSLSNCPSNLDEVLRLDRVRFDERHRLPAVAGIYFVLYESNASRIAYIGKAKCFERRWAGHHRLPELFLLEKLGIPTQIAWFEADEADLEVLEHRLIGLFTPPLNDGPTLRRLQDRSLPVVVPVTRTEILREFRDRYSHALQLLVSEELWHEANSDERGDCLCVWPFKNRAETMDVDMLWSYRDNHDLLPSRIVCPPAFAANDTYKVEPKVGFVASWAERVEWTLAIARQVDAFLFAVASFHASTLAPKERQIMFANLGTLKTLEGTLRAEPELLARGLPRPLRITGQTK